MMSIQSQIRQRVCDKCHVVLDLIGNVHESLEFSSSKVEGRELNQLASLSWVAIEKILVEELYMKSKLLQKKVI
jgi:hypothetical protein